MRGSTTVWRGLAIVAIAALGGCATVPPTARPQVLTINYAVAILRDGQATQVVNDVVNNRATIAALMVPSLTNNFWTNCNFTASFAGTPPQLFLSRALPDEQGFFVRLTMTSPVNLTTTNIPRCGSIGELSFDIGDARSTSRLRLGDVTRETEGGIRLADGRDFSNPRFATGTVIALDTTSRRTSGAFNLIGSVGMTGGTTTVFIAEGRFDMTAVAP